MTRDTAHNAATVQQAAIDRDAASLAPSQRTSPANRYAYVVKNPRLLSDWESNVIRVDLRGKNATTRTQPFELDLSKLTVNLEEGSNDSVGVIALAQFPNLIDPIKLAVNARLHQCENGVPENEISVVVWNCQRLFTYLLRKSVYSLAAVTREQLNELAKEVAENGWFVTLNVEEALSRLLAKFEVNPEHARDVLGLSNVPHQTINVERLALALGIFVPRDRIPTTFRQALDQMHPVKGRPYKVGQCKQDAKSSTSLKSLLTTMNLLSRLPEGFDSITFEPFHCPNKTVQTYFESNSGRTKNIEIADAVRLFAECLRWIYDYRPTVHEILQTTRYTATQAALPGASPLKVQLPLLLPRFKECLAATGISAFEAYEDVYALLNDILHLAFSACATLIASNHGRRINEVVGCNRDYGAYYGCIRSMGVGSADVRIELYVQKKKAQAYYDFWCNQVIRDSVSLLEEIAQTLRPLGAAPLANEPDRRLARLQRLFRMRSFPESFKSQPSSAFDWNRHGKLLLSRAKTSLEPFTKGPPPFRRLFICLYLHRYEFPELIPLHQHIRHLTLSTLCRYGSDPANREHAKTVDALLKCETDDARDLQKLLKEGAVEYLRDYVERLLRGDAIGGGFPRLVKDFAKRLLIRPNFREKPARDQADAIARSMNDQGFIANEKPTGPCMAGSGVPTEHLAKCREDGVMRSDRASPTLCCGCVHSATSPEIREGYRVEMRRAEDVASNFRLSPKLRSAASKTVVTLQRVIVLEEKMALTNMAYFNALYGRERRMEEAS